MSAVIKTSDFGSKIVTKHNDLITARFDLTVTEFKLLVGCISKVNSFDKITSDTEFSFTLEEAEEIFGFDPKNNGAVYHFKQAALGLMSKQLINETVSDWQATNIAQDAYFDAETKRVAICFSRKIVPYISNLAKKNGDKWTSYRLMHIGQMKSKYALNLYELLIMDLMRNYYHDKFKDYTIVEFKKTLGIADNKYPSISMLKSRVISPAIEEINKYSDIFVAVKYFKKGRAINSLRLEYRYKDEWANAELQHRKNKKLTKKQVKKILNHADFYEDFKDTYSELGVMEFFQKAESLLLNNPSVFGNLEKYLK